MVAHLSYSLALVLVWLKAVLKRCEYFIIVHFQLCFQCCFGLLSLASICEAIRLNWALLLNPTEGLPSPDPLLYPTAESRQHRLFEQKLDHISFTLPVRPNSGNVQLLTEL